MNRNISVIKDLNENKIVIINDMLIRHANDGKMYLYNILEIKKEMYVFL